MKEQGLKDKTVRGVGWSAADNVTRHAVTFIITVVLARLLSPDDYGLLGIITIFTAIGTTLVNGGFSNALIRQKDVTDDDYNTVFIVNLGVSLFLYVVIFLCSPWIANFFGRGELVQLTRIASLVVILGAFALVQHTRLTKSIDFKTQTKITLIASVGSGMVGITMALLGCGVWSLVAQMLLSQFLRTVLLWVYNRWYPCLKFSRTSFNSLFGYGWKIMVSSILDTLWKEMYQVIVGRFYSTATLGQYTRAKQFSQLFSSNLTAVIQQVTFPVLSNIQDDKQRLISAYRRIIKTTMFLTAVSMFFLGAISEPLLYCLIGPKWHEAATYLPLICVAGSLYPLHAINLNMLQVQGRSDLYLALEIIKKALILIPLSVGALVGIMPMLYVNLIIGVITFYLNSYWTGKFLGYSFWMQVKDVAPSYEVAILVALPVWFLQYLPLSYWVILPLQMVVAAVTFFIVVSGLRLEEYKEVRDLVSSKLGRLSRRGSKSVDNKDLNIKNNK